MGKMRDLTWVREVKETRNVKEANDLLQVGWSILAICETERGVCISLGRPDLQRDITT